jgi:uncharacterized protein YyaL (SSP411 family)
LQRNGIAPRPILTDGERRTLDDHLTGALDWITRAHAAVDDGGLSKGYHVIRNFWFPSYPETTGYTIPTLLNAASALGQPHLRDMALSLAEYLLSSVTAEGGIVHWRDRGEPVVFDTGQVMFGWLAAFDATGESRYLEAATRAGDWLVSVQDPSGAWRRFQYLGVTKVIDTRVAWALLELSRRTGRPLHYEEAAERNLAWAITQQQENGWFRCCAFREAEDPLTHTLAYTAEGLLESGLLRGENRYVDAARRTADALLACQRPDGSLASTYSAAWRATRRSSCLTGNCQVSRLWLCLYELDGRDSYLTAARRAIDFVAGTQDLETARLDVRGGIAGSHPIYGRYERFKYPNWAAKFFVDALLTIGRLATGGELLPYAG